MIRVLLFIACFVSGLVSSAQNSLTAENLTLSWKVYRRGEFQDFNSTSTSNAIHFQLQPSFSNTYLQVSSTEDFSLFLDGKLVAPLVHKSLRVSIDSLSKSNRRLFFSIYVPNGVSRVKISTSIIGPNKTSGDPLYERLSSGRSDFFILSSVLLILGFSFLSKSNPRLMADYLSLVKTFSLKEREGMLTSNRMTSAVNILFYVLVCYLVAFLILFWLPVASDNSFLTTLLQWNILAAFIFSFLFAKFTLISLFSFIFRLKSIRYLHFNNFIRVVILTATILMIVALWVYISHAAQENIVNSCYWVIFFFASAWLVMMYLKLLTNALFSFSHLFFYLCITEVFPFFLVLKFIS